MRCGKCKAEDVTVGHVKVCYKDVLVAVASSKKKVATVPTTLAGDWRESFHQDLMDYDAAHPATQVIEVPELPKTGPTFPPYGRYAAVVSDVARHFIVKPSKSGKGYCAYKVGGHYAGFIFNDGGVSAKDFADKPYLQEIVAAGPEASAILYGKTTGHCSICGKELRLKESIQKGIGSKCAKGTLWSV